MTDEHESTHTSAAQPSAALVEAELETSLFEESKAHIQTTQAYEALFAENARLQRELDELLAALEPFAENYRLFTYRNRLEQSFGHWVFCELGDSDIAAAWEAEFERAATTTAQEGGE